MSGLGWWLATHPVALWLLLALYTAVTALTVRALLPGTRTVSAAPPAARHRVRDATDEAFETLPPGVAGPGREAKARILAEIEAMGPPPLTVHGHRGGRGVLPVEDLPVVRLHSCSYCRDDGAAGPDGCRWCGAVNHLTKAEEGPRA